MSSFAEDIKSLSAPQKAELYYLLGQDEELNNYLFSDQNLFKELARRDNAYAEGSILLMTRQEVTSRLHKRRNGV